MAKKTEYAVTFGYKAVVTLTIKAESADQAKEWAMDEFNKFKGFGKNSVIEDDNYAVDGIVNMDATWNMVQS